MKQTKIMSEEDKLRKSLSDIKYLIEDIEDIWAISSDAIYDEQYFRDFDLKLAKDQHNTIFEIYKIVKDALDKQK